MNIVLTGFMGSGKTTVGRRLAEVLDRRFVDTDVVIESRHGPIPEIFATQGEEAFRRMERTLAAELGAQQELVVATGGGLVLDPEARASLEASGRVFCLVADVEELGRRLAAGMRDRPLLHTDDPSETIRELLRERAEAYASFEAVDTTGRTPDEIVADIVGRVS